MRKLGETYRNILHIFFVGYVEILPKKLKQQILYHGLFTRWFFYPIYIFQYFFNWMKAFLYKETHVFNHELLYGKVWFFANTKNQFNALHSIFESMESCVWVSRNFKVKGEKFILITGLRRIVNLSKFGTISLALKKQVPRKIKGYLPKIFEAAGQYEYLQSILMQYHPQAVVISNDHGIMSRSLLLAAKSLGIPTVYIQHAVVSEYFPNLEADLNLLEGQHAFDKYKTCGTINGRVEFVGMAKFDAYLSHRKFNKRVESVGLCFNPADKLSNIEITIQQLGENFPSINFTFRMHPRDNRNLRISNLSNVMQSDSNHEDSFTFLTCQDMIIAGDTSIHLEATLLNIPCVYFSFSGSNELKDYYGFIRNRLIEEAYNLQDLKQWISEYQQEKPQVYTKAIYYNALVGTDLEGKSKDIAIHFIKELLATSKNYG